MFSRTQIDSLFLRLRQTKEELLYSAKSQQVERYALTRKDGAQFLGVAHCDFVEDAWSYPTYFPRHTEDSPQGIDNRFIRAGQVDDRVGVWLLLDVLPEMLHGIPFDTLLTTDEECGRSSASEVIEPLDYNWTFQFDRRGTDFVDYGLASKKFISVFKVATKIPHGIGSFSDICSLDDSCGSRVNIGTAYYDEHSPDAYVDLEQCFSQVTRFVRFARKHYATAFPFKRAPRKPYKSPAHWGTAYKDATRLERLNSQDMSGNSLDELDAEFDTMFNDTEGML